MQSCDVIALKPSSTLIVEDNAFLSTELYEALDEAGLNPMQPVGYYAEALACLSERSPRFCVLDLDLGRRISTNTQIGEEGRRLLAILGSRGCRTVVYSAFARDMHNLLSIDPNVEVISKTCPVEDVVTRLQRIATEAA